MRKQERYLPTMICFVCEVKILGILHYIMIMFYNTNIRINNTNVSKNVVQYFIS